MTKNREKLLAELADVPTERRPSKICKYDCDYYNTQVILLLSLLKVNVTGRLFMKKKVKMASVTIHSFLAQKKAVLLQN